MASTMFATEISASAFMGTTLSSSAATSGPARVTMMSYSREELERKPLSLIRQLARKQGLPMNTKQVMINSLASGSFSYSKTSTQSAPSYSYSSSSSSSAPSSGDASAYASMSLGELRQMASARGLRGDTRAEIITLLASSPAPAAAASAPAAGGLAALPKAVLERKSLSELRALARIRGLRGDTKAELVKMLASNSGSNGAAAATSYSSPTSYSYIASESSSSNGASNGSAHTSAAIRQLSVKSMSQLRAMAAIKGIRGGTKDELVKQLAAAV